jgi:hypothetical protein
MSQSQTRYLVTFLAAGRQVPGNWAMSGGRPTGEAIMDRAPGAEYPNASGGDKSLEPITLRARVEIAQLTDAERTRVNGLVMVDNACTVNRKPLDRNGNPFGKGDTWIGTLTSGLAEETDPNADGEPAEVEVEIQPSRKA